MKTHINRRHAGAGRPIPKIATEPIWTGGVGYKTRFKNNNFSITNHNPKADDLGVFQFVDTPFTNEPIPMLRLNIFGASVNFQ